MESTVDAQRRLYRLGPELLREIDTWLAQFRRHWSVHVDALERHLDRLVGPDALKFGGWQRLNTEYAKQFSAS